MPVHVPAPYAFHVKRTRTPKPSDARGGGPCLATLNGRAGSRAPRAAEESRRPLRAAQAPLNGRVSGKGASSPALLRASAGIHPSATPRRRAGRRAGATNDEHPWVRTAIAPCGLTSGWSQTNRASQRGRRNRQPERTFRALLRQRSQRPERVSRPKRVQIAGEGARIGSRRASSAGPTARERSGALGPARSDPRYVGGHVESVDPGTPHARGGLHASGRDDPPVGTTASWWARAAYGVASPGPRPSSTCIGAAREGRRHLSRLT